jgi:hypothetical protein
MSSWVTQLPNQVGCPAGGSLTSDEWKGLTLVFGPIVIYNRSHLFGMNSISRTKAHDTSIAGKNVKWIVSKET